MDSLLRSIDKGIADQDYGAIASVFSPTGWMRVGQGEQRSLAAHFVKMVVQNKTTFLPAALKSETMMHTMTEALAHLPSTVDNAADNTLRQLLFEYLVQEEGEYAAAARILGGMRMEDATTSVYYMSPADKCDVYVKIAECFLQEDDIVESDAAVTKAGSVVESIPNQKDHLSLILRYKSTYARVLDSNRKFLQAASRYHELSSRANESIIQSDDLLQLLGRAATCAILAPPNSFGPQRHRVLGHIFKDDRLHELDSISEFRTHSSILTKMYKQQLILGSSNDVEVFKQSLAPHQQAVMGDGLTILERGIVEHNMIAISKLYKRIYLSELALLLNNSKAEQIAANMILDGSLSGSMDQVEGILEFHSNSAASTWDPSITSFCAELNTISETIAAKQQQQEQMAP